VDICERIGLKPTYAQSVGLERFARDGTPLGGHYKETYVSIPLTGKVEGDFVEGVRNALTSLKDKSTVFRFLIQSGGRCELFIGVFSDGKMGFTLTAKDMSDLSFCNLDVSIDAYMEES
jgi:hypothetical protein